MSDPFATERYSLAEPFALAPHRRRSSAGPLTRDPARGTTGDHAVMFLCLVRVNFGVLEEAPDAAGDEVERPVELTITTSVEAMPVLVLAGAEVCGPPGVATESSTVGIHWARSSAPRSTIPLAGRRYLQNLVDFSLSEDNYHS